MNEKHDTNTKKKWENEKGTKKKENTNAKA